MRHALIPIHLIHAARGTNGRTLPEGQPDDAPPDPPANMMGDVAQPISSPVLVGRGAELARLGFALDPAAADVPADMVDGVPGGSRP